MAPDGDAVDPAEVDAAAGSMALPISPQASPNTNGNATASKFDPVRALGLEPKSGDAADASPKAPSDSDEAPPPPVPQFSAAEPPALVDAHSITIDSVKMQWPEVSQTGLSGEVPEGASYPDCIIAYGLELREEYAPVTRDSKAPEQVPGEWMQVYRGLQNAAQVRNLRPGRSYAFRVVPLPVSEVFADIPPQPPSKPATYDTTPAPPAQPEPPSLVMRARTSLKFKWAEPHETGGRPIDEYQLDIFPPPGPSEEAATAQDWVRLFEGPELSFKAVRMRPGVRYSVRLKAVNEIGESALSRAVPFTTQSSVPDQPAPPTAAFATPDSITVQWEPPHDNGDPISQYRLERDDGDGGDFELAYTGPDCGALVGGLQSGVPYRFRLWAFNNEGKSAVSSVSVATTAAAVADAPAAPRILDRRRTTVQLQWSAPEADGGSPVISHQLEMRPRSYEAVAAGMPDEWLIMYTGAEPACMLGNLRAGCKYLVRARCQNVAGWSASSAPKEVLTMPDVPYAPFDLQLLSRVQEMVELAWLPPAFDGGAPVSSYRLDMARVGAPASLPALPGHVLSPQDKGKRGLESDLYFSEVYTGPEARYQVDALDPGIEYHFRVHAANSQGISAPSATLRTRTLAAPPVAPAAPSLAGPAAANSLKVAWQSPPERGAPVSGFMLEMMVHEQSADRQPGDRSPELGTASETGAEVSESQQPGLRPSAEARLPFRLVFQGESCTCQIKALESNSRYAFRVRAASDAGSSEWSQVVVMCTAASTPSACAPPTATATAFGTLQVEWQPPERDNGSPISAYTLEYSLLRGRVRVLDALLVWQTGYSGAEQHCQLTGLQAGRQYQLRVRAMNGRGSGGWSELAAAWTSAAAPAAPAAPSFSHRTATSLRAKWEAPDEDHGSPVVNYRLEVRAEASDESEYRDAYLGPLTSCKLYSLQPSTAYFLRLQAANSEGYGAFSEEVPFSTAKPPPPPPTAVRATAPATAGAAASIVVSWQAASGGETTQCFAACASYEVEAARSGGGAPPAKQSCSAKLSDCILTGVAPGTEYQVRLRSVGAEGAGHSAWSEPVSVSTPGVPPPTEATRGGLSDSTAGPNASATKRDRVARRKAATSADEDSDARPRSVGSRAARPPPMKRWPALKRWARRTQLLNWLSGAAVFILLYLLCSLAYSTNQERIKKPTRR